MLLAEIEARGGWNICGRHDQGTIRRKRSASCMPDHEFKIGSGRYDEKLRRLAEVMADVKQRD